MRAEQLGLDRLADILLRRLLYLVVRPRLTPADGAPALDFSRPVCYVLHDRRLSDLLVIEEETRRAVLPSALGPMAAPLAAEKRSVFFIGRARNPLAPASARATHSPRLVRLVRATLRDPSVDVQLVPVTILWGRSPGTQTSLLKALFAEAWETAGALRQLVTILVHGRQVEVKLAPAVSLRELIADTTDEERALRKASRLFRVHFRRQREAAIGPDLSHRHMQIEGMLASAPLRQAIAGEAQAKGSVWKKRANGHAASPGRSLPTIRIRLCARSSCSWADCGTGCTTASTCITSRLSSESPRGTASSICPATAATSTICCCHSWSAPGD